MLFAIKSMPIVGKMPKLLPATTCVCLMLALLTNIHQPTSASAASASTNVPSTSNQTSSSSSQTTDAGKSAETKSSSSSKTIGSSSSQVSGTEQQQQQATDMSNMYVQIPIAEPADTGVPEGVQQTLTGTVEGDGSGASGDSGKATSWTGPWPKKFQIGYIKQSDLHQVLIESLKNDPFVSLSSPSGSPVSKTSATSTPAPQAAKKPPPPVKMGTVSSDSSSLMSAQKAPAQQWANNVPFVQSPIQRPQQQQQQVVMNKNNHYQQHQPMTNFRDARQLQQPFNHQMNRYHQNFNQLRRPFNQHQQQHHHQQQQQQQFQKQQLQFAGFPSNTFKNQPVYTINNYPTEQLDPNSMQLILPQQQQQQQQFQSSSRPQKSAEYYSSWRPVTSGDKNEQQQQVQVANGKTQQFDYSGGLSGDAFDDGFNSPSKDAVATGSMNRHPMLNSYLSSNAANPASSSSSTNSGVKGGSKLSPALVSPGKSKQQVEAGTKSSSSSGVGATKGSTKGIQQGVKGAQDSDAQLSAGRRRAINGTSSTTTAASTSATGVDGSTESATTTTLSPTTEAGDFNSTSASTTSASTQSTTVESETTDPDSVTISEDDSDDSSTTTASPATGSSTTGSSSSTTTEQAAASESNSSTTTAASVQQQTSSDSSEAEVATQGAAQQSGGGTASLPSLPGSDDGFTQSSVQRSSSTPGSSGSSSTTNASTREETTPSSATSSSSSTTAGETKGEIEADDKSAKIDSSMSDEALMAVSAQKGAEIAKTGNQRSANTSGSGSGSKKTRSSERLQGPNQQQQAALNQRKSSSAKTSSNGRKSSSSVSGNRAAKQVAVSSDSQGVNTSVGGGVKGSSSAKLSAARKSNKKRTSTGKPQKASSQKSTRMVQQSERLQQQPQVVSMTAAQAQSTAQTLASLLLSRCMSSAGCAHLLDMCTTKQAVIPLTSTLGSDQNGGNALTNSNNSAAWSMPVGLMSSSIVSLTQTLQADKVLRLFPQWKDAIDNVVDHDTQTGYTLILPSNEAIDRLPEATVDSWLANSDLLTQIIENHIIDASETIEFTAGGAKTRLIRSKGLQVNQHRDKMVTINGKRLVYANQAAPSGGRIHVIDGILDWPLSSSGGFSQPKLLDIMDTLKQCDKFDGFVTLAEGTGLTQILKQDGPMTVFVPSNEALRKIPDEELEVIKNNSTALKEFLMYHVVNGSYFSQDLRDGQQLASILDMKPIQVGVRVDGCSRRLVEANTSPMRRPDIVAKNGVIHILDWYLTVRDNDWCDPIGRSALTSSAATSAAAASVANSPASTASDRLQQLASESGASYATRMVLPANHKLSSSVLSEVPLQPSNLQKGSLLGLDTNNIIVSATPLAFGDINRSSSAAAAKA